MNFADTENDRYEFDFIWSYGKEYVEVTHHYNHAGKWEGWTRFAVKIENNIIQWDKTEPVSQKAISYIEKVFL